MAKGITYCSPRVPLRLVVELSDGSLVVNLGDFAVSNESFM